MPRCAWATCGGLIMRHVIGWFQMTLCDNVTTRLFRHEDKTKQWLKEVRLYRCVSQFFYIMAERTKHIHAQCSFRFLAERHKTLANRTTTFAKTTGHHVDASHATSFRLQGKRLVFQVVKSSSCSRDTFCFLS